MTQFVLAAFVLSCIPALAYALALIKLGSTIRPPADPDRRDWKTP